MAISDNGSPGLPPDPHCGWGFLDSPHPHLDTGRLVKARKPIFIPVKGFSPMSEHDQSRKFADKSATIANEALQKGKQVAEQSVHAIEQGFSDGAEKMRVYNLKMIDMAQVNAEGVFQFARQLAAAKSPSDFSELWAAHAKKQFTMLSEQIKEMTALGQKIVSESAEPLAHSVNQAFKKAS